MNNLQSVFDKWENRYANRHKSSNSPNDFGLASNGSLSSLDHKENKLKWKKKYAESEAYTARRKRKHYNSKTTGNLEVESLHLASFKTFPIVTASDFEVERPFSIFTCNCTELSRKEFLQPQFKKMPVVDLLNVDRYLLKKNRLFRYFRHLSFVALDKSYFSYADVMSRVMQSPRLDSTINETASTLVADKTDTHKLTSVAKRLWKITGKYAYDMRTRISNLVLLCTAWVLTKFFTKCLSRIQIHSGQLAMVRAASKRDIPIVYLPTHRSHLDYVLITFTLWLHGIRVPHIAAGDNLNLPLFRWFMKRQGAFFIRRKLDRSTDQKDVIYRALLHSYMEEVLKAGESIEFFIEGGRSRTGKPGQPKAGLLSVIVESCLEENSSDALIVPVSINYERLMENGFSQEQMGCHKVAETFVNVIRGLYFVFMSFYGSVRVDFCPPFSLKEYLRVSNECLSASGSDCDSPVPSRSVLDDQSDRLSRGGSFSTGQFVVEKHRTLVQNLARHVLYSSTQSTTLTCTNLLAFLLFTQFRQGTSMRNLTQSFNKLVYKLTSVYKRDVSFSGPDREVIVYALNIYDRRLLNISENENNNETFVSPVMSLPHVFDLLYYANAVVPIFILESIIGVCSLSLSELNVPVLRTSSELKSAIFSRSQLIHDSLRLSRLLQDEFILVAPCMSLENVVIETIDMLIHSEVLEVDEPFKCLASSVEEQQWLKRHRRWALNDDSEEDNDTDGDNLKLKVEQEDCGEKIAVFTNIVGPYVEALLMTAELFESLSADVTSEESFLQSLHSVAMKKYEDRQIIYLESVAMETLRNAVKALCRLKYADNFAIGAFRVISSNSDEDSEERLTDLRHFLISLLM